MISGSKTLLSCLIFLLLPVGTTAQRFLRTSGSMDNDFRGEMKLDENEALSGMTREMFLMQDIDWQLQPPILKPDSELDTKAKSHVQKYLARHPIQLKLLKKKGKYGLRAVGQTSTGQKLRAFWRQGVTDRIKSSDFLHVSYDDAVRSRLFTVEFEVVLPPMRGSRKLPSVVYQLPLEPGTMNPKSMVMRGAGKVRVYPQGRGEGAPCVNDAGICNASVSMKPGLVDPSWAKGRAIFRKGRSLGRT